MNRVMQKRIGVENTSEIGKGGQDDVTGMVSPADIE